MPKLPTFSLSVDGVIWTMPDGKPAENLPIETVLALHRNFDPAAHKVLIVDENGVPKSIEEALETLKVHFQPRNVPGELPVDAHGVAMSADLAVESSLAAIDVLRRTPGILSEEYNYLSGVRDGMLALKGEAMELTERMHRIHKRVSGAAPSQPITGPAAPESTPTKPE